MTNDEGAVCAEDPSCHFCAMSLAITSVQRAVALESRREQRPANSKSEGQGPRPPVTRAPLLEHESHSRQRHNAGEDCPLTAPPNGSSLSASRQDSPRSNAECAECPPK